MRKLLAKNRFEVGIFLLIVIIAAVLRFYQLPGYMTFLGDEGRDAIIVEAILVDRHFPLLGPPTSVGNIYLGPLYYYMMAGAMAFFWLNPVAAAGMVAVIGTASVGLIYWLARRWFGFWPAVLASVLYALSPINIIYSRSSWNPNPAPFFALLSILGLDLARRRGDFRWFILTGIALAFVVQMHYLALILLPVYALLWGYELLRKKKGREYQNFWPGTIVAVLCFFFLMSPLLLFDLRHNFMNFNAAREFFSDRQTTVNLNVFNTVSRMLPIYTDKLVGKYMSGGNNLVAQIISGLILLAVIVFPQIKGKSWKLKWPYLALGTWLVVGIAGLSLYKQTIYDHYLGFINPVPYLLLGGLIAYLKGRQRWVAAAILLLGLGYLNLQKLPLTGAPNNQLSRTQAVAGFVIRESAGKPFNFALIAEHNYDAAYQYYLDLFGHAPQKLPWQVADQLFVVCEDSVCRPVGHPKYEIAAFGWTKIESEEDFAGVKVFKLIHNPEQKNVSPPLK